MYGLEADIWSLGIVTIELIDGLPPFMDSSPLKAMLMIRLPHDILLNCKRWEDSN
jgi:serine/threonine protein kinase